MKYYKTKDILLAATLRVLGYELKEIELDENKGIFHFSGVDEQVIQDFDFGRIRVEPVSFNNAVKQLTTSVRRKLSQK